MWLYSLCFEGIYVLYSVGSLVGILGGHCPVRQEVFVTFVFYDGSLCEL